MKGFIYTIIVCHCLWTVAGFQTSGSQLYASSSDIASSTTPPCYGTLKSIGSAVKPYTAQAILIVEIIVTQFSYIGLFLRQQACYPLVYDEESALCQTTCVAERVRKSCTESETIYFECVSSIWTQQQCPFGQKFLGSQSSSPCGTATVSVCTNGEIRSSDNGADKYYICQSNSWQEKSCGAGQIFQNDGNSSPPCASTATSVCSNGATKASENGNNKYYLCINNNWQERSCSSGQIYQSDGSSSYPCISTTVQVVCSEGSVKPSGNGNSRYYMCMDNAWQERACPFGKVFDVNSSNADPCTSVILIHTYSKKQYTGSQSCSQDGHRQWYPSDTRKYYECSSGVYVVKSCSDKTSFNKAYGKCS